MKSTAGISIRRSIVPPGVSSIFRGGTAQSVPVAANVAALEVLPEQLQSAILLFYSLLDEQQRRLYAGLESMRLGHGGDTLLADFLHLDAHTVARGRQQLLDGEVTAGGRTRRPGGGADSHGKKTPEIISIIENLLEHDTAGDPITGLKWSRRTTDKIASLLGSYGFSISPHTVARLLHAMDFSLRVNRKSIATDSSSRPKSPVRLHR